MTVWAASLVMPPVRVVPVTGQLRPLVWAVRVLCRALVLLVTLMVMLVSVVLRVSSSLATPVVRALLVMLWGSVPLVVLRR